MRGLDAWITGNYGEDHPDNQICSDCGRDADYHCTVCGGCGAPGYLDDAANICDVCARTCDYCGAEEVEGIRVHVWMDRRGKHRDRLCPQCWAINFENESERG